MKTPCVITPTIKVNNQEVVSKLFNELVDYTGNIREAQNIWSLAQTKTFRESVPNLEYDINGEPTIESLTKVLDIKGYLNGGISLKGLKKEAGAINKNGDTIKYTNSEKAINNASNFNKDNPKYVASVQETDGKYTIEVGEKTIENSDVPQKLIFNNSLNNKLLGILRSVGFDVSIKENLQYAGIFNPLEAVTTAEGLRTIIQIAKGERGEKAFPEEFAHAMIAGLGNHALVKRLMDTLSMPVIEKVLGDQFEAYNKKYKGNQEMLRKEAAGKILQKHIVGEAVEPQQRSLISRIWNWIKSQLGLINESLINEAINEANKEAGELAQFIMSDNIESAIDTDLILNEKELYNLEEETSSMEKMTNEALELLSKRLKILAARSKSGKYNKDDVLAIRKLQDLIERKKYSKGCILFLQEVYSQIDDLQKRLKSLKNTDTRSNFSLSKIRSVSSVLRQIKEFSEAYEPIVNRLMTLPSMREDNEVEITEEDAETISDLASNVTKIINNINRNYKKMQFDTIYNYLKRFWSGDQQVSVDKNKSITIKERDKEGNIVEKQIKTISLAMILKMAYKDINGVDTWISSMSDASDPLLALVAKAVKTSHVKRDNVLNEILSGVRAAHRKLKDAGYTSTDFMYERDSKGNLTGRIISEIDYDKFNRDRNAYIKSLQDQGLKKYQIKSKVEVWERTHMENNKVEGSTSERTEMRPAKSLYGKPGALSHLSSAQREYYNVMMKVKTMLEDNLPQMYTNTFRAVQISKDMTEAVTDNLGNPKKAVELILNRAKSKFIRRVDDSEFGEDVKDSEKGTILLDFAGNPIDKLPIYYTSPLENPKMLSTDFTASILAYASMAVNYGEMSKVIDVLELTRDLIKNREVQQLSGDKALVESFKAVHKKFNKAYTKPGRDTNIGKRIDEYYASVIYGKTKKDEGSVNVLGKQVDVAKTLDTFKSYTGAVGLGLNLFSSISNVTVGKMQIFIEAVGGEYFGIKDSIVSKKNYWKDLPEYLGELNDSQKKSKMALLIDKFDALEEFNSKLSTEGYYRGGLSKIFGNTSLYILNNLGEHYLHTRTMLAMLNHYKVKLGNKEMSLYDAMEVVKNEDGEYSIKVRDGVTKIDGSAITEEDLDTLKMQIGRVNQSLNGAFNEDDKGAIHRHALGRLAMQFRQWMPAHYYRRFAKSYNDPILNQNREGYYRTLGRFTLDLMKDIKNAKFQLATRWGSLSKHEQANLRRAGAEITMFLVLAGLIAMMGPAKDKKGIWYDRWILYNLKKMKLEAGASMPLTPDFLDNIWTILKSPAPAIKSFNNITDLLKFINIFNEIESGRYKGWSVYEKDITEVIPIYGQIRKVVDLPTEDYMFNTLNSKN